MSTNHSKTLRIALAHDYLVKNGGAEKVLEELHVLFPIAPVFTLLYDETGTSGRYANWDIRTSWLQKAPRAVSKIDYYRALMPQAVESFDLSDFDLVISDSSSFIKGVITQPQTLHISYIHTPTRFLWFDVSHHIGRARFLSVAKSIIPAVLHRVRQWDTIAAQRPDVLIANSRTTQSRIKKFYHRPSTIIYPPVSCERFDSTKRNPQDYFLIISRLEAHKDIDVAIKAANTIGAQLKIVGVGGDLARLLKMAGPTIHFLGYQTDTEVEHHLYHAKALLAPQTEDFGITLVESLAAGCPVITKDAGGGAEIVRGGVSGIVVKGGSVEGFAQAMQHYESSAFKVAECVEQAQQFSRERFRASITSLINEQRERGAHGTS